MSPLRKHIFTLILNLLSIDRFFIRQALQTPLDAHIHVNVQCVKELESMYNNQCISATS